VNQPAGSFSSSLALLGSEFVTGAVLTQKTFGSMEKNQRGFNNNNVGATMVGARRIPDSKGGKGAVFSGVGFFTYFGKQKTFRELE